MIFSKTLINIAQLSVKFWSFDLPAMPMGGFIAVMKSQCYAPLIILIMSMLQAGGYSNFDIVERKLHSVSNFDIRISHLGILKILLISV